MKRILYDTNVVYHIFRGASEYRRSLDALALNLVTEDIEQYISVVTHQELAVYGRMNNCLSDILKHLEVTYNSPLDLTKRCADVAAELWECRGRPPRDGTSKDRRQAVNTWHRDSSIMATAIVHQMDLVVTCENGFVSYARKFNGRIEIIKAELPKPVPIQTQHDAEMGSGDGAAKSESHGTGLIVRKEQ